MSVALVAQTTIAGACPTAASAVGAVYASLQAQLAGALEASLRLSITPPTLSAQLDAAVAIEAAIKASITLGLPTIDIQIAALAALVASLNAQIAALLAFQATFGEQVFLYAGSAQAKDIGAQTAAALAGGPPGVPPLSECAIVALVATVPSARAALGVFFGVSL